MHSRRQFVSVVAAGLGAALVPDWVLAQDGIKTSLNGPVGLQLWSLREYLPKDLSGTLAKVRALGFRDVEGAGLWKHSSADMRAAMNADGLRCHPRTCRSSGCEMIPREHFRSQSPGRQWVVCPWIPHEKAFTREDALARRKPSTGSPPRSQDQPAFRVSLSWLRVRSLA